LSAQSTRIVKGLKDLGRQSKGGSGSHILECDDGKKYVVKFADGSKNVVNEFLGYELSKPLLAPVYEHALVDVDVNLIKQSPDLSQRGISAGLHHGVEHHPTAKDLDGQTLDGLQILNAASAASVIVVDNWIFNTDRNNGGNVLLEPELGGWKVIATDFNCSLSGNWTVETLSVTATNRNMVDTHPLFTMVVSGQNPFNQAFGDIQQVEPSYIQSTVDTIPFTWPLTVDERIALVTCLEKRKLDVPETIRANKTRFPKWST
jgi:hypothetical protein